MQEKQNGSFWGYLRAREISHFPTNRLRWWLLGLIVIGWAVEQYEGLKTGPVLVYILEDFDKTLTQWGYVAASAGLVYSIGAQLLSRAADRFGRRPLLVWPVFFYAVVSVCGALAPNFYTLAVLAMAGSFLMAGMNPAVHAASRDLTPQMGRAMVYAWVSLAFTVGALMSTVIAANTLPHFPGWRPQYWIGAGLGIVTAALLFFFYRDLAPGVRGSVTSEPAAGTDHYEAGRLIYRSPRLWILSGTIVFWSLTYVTVSGYVPTYLARHHGLDPARAAAVTSWFWVVFTMSVFIAGWLSDHFRVRKPVTAFGAITTGTCFIVGSSLPVDTPEITLMLLWSATGFFAGFIYPCWCALYSETAEAISPHGVGRAFGITATLSPIAGLFLNLGLPRVVENYGWSTWMMCAGFFCLGVALLVGAGKGPWWPEKPHAARS
ncbi:MAG: MFS transporter [Gammaproteobacteria bacterium]|nr:MFS transporter [Gammaproteobacteria bacterium]